MQGVLVNSDNESYNLRFDKSFFDERQIKKILELIEIQILADKVNFDENILVLAKEIKTKIWNRVKSKYHFENKNCN
jgi:hypothetical protein